MIEISNERLDGLIQGLQSWLDLGRSAAPDLEQDIVSALTELRDKRTAKGEAVAYIVGRKTRDGETAFHLPFLRAGEDADRYRDANPEELMIPLYLHPHNKKPGE